jgi:3',5'-cyclic AMP phosphodiesterase CpdA
MHLGRTPYEAIIEASGPDLAALGASVAALALGERFEYAASVKDWPPGVTSGTLLTVTCTTGSFLALWSADGNLRIEGNAAILNDFAASFDFGPKVHTGAHAHWDLAGRSNDVHEDSLSLVVQVA